MLSALAPRHSAGRLLPSRKVAARFSRPPGELTQLSLSKPTRSAAERRTPDFSYETAQNHPACGHTHLVFLLLGKWKMEGHFGQFGVFEPKRGLLPADHAEAVSPARGATFLGTLCGCCRARVIQSQNHLGWERPPRPPSPASDLALPSPQTHEGSRNSKFP